VLLKQNPEKAVPDQQEGAPAADITAAAPVADPRDLKEKTFVKADGPVILETKFSIYFDYNSYDLSEDAISVLDKIFLILSQYPDKTIFIKGFTDNTGKLSYNLKLSEARATAVRNYFVEKGIKPININTMAIGPDRKLDEGGNEKPKQMNRRVEIQVN